MKTIPSCLLVATLVMMVQAIAAAPGAQPVPAEFISEVIPIKYARASEITDVLNSLSSPGNGNPKLIQRLRARGVASADLPNIGTIKAVTDDRSNSILIFATNEDMKKLKNLVSKLDVPLRQILIEAVVVEVPLADSRSAGKRPSGNQPLAASDCLFGNHFRQLTNLVRVAITNDTAVQEGFSYVVGLGDSFDAMAAALGNEHRASVIQKPRILTADGMTASLFIGSTRPSLAPPGNDSSAGAPHSCGPPLEIGFALQITPRLASNGLIALGILAEASKIIGTTNIAGVGDVPVTASISLTASVTVRDGELIMIGGEVRPPPPRSSGIPVLKHIPVLGALFRGSSSRRPRTELVVLLRPSVLSGAGGVQGAQAKLVPREGFAPSTFPF